MFDLDTALVDMLDRNRWKHGREIRLSNIADPKVYESTQCHLSFRWYSTEPDIVLRLFCLYVRTFPHASFDSLYNDLARPVKHGTGNATKRGHLNNNKIPILFEHYFSRDGVVVAITDQGEGFDFRGTYARYTNKEKYFTHHGAGFGVFANCGSRISYENGGRTLLVQYSADSANSDTRHVSFSSAGDGPAPFEIMDNLPGPKLSQLYKLALCDPNLLRLVWKDRNFLKAYVCPGFPDQHRVAAVALGKTSEIVGASTRTAVIRYRAADDVIVAEFFRRRDDGERAYNILRAAWRGGLDAAQPHQVPKPIAYHAAPRLLLTRPNNGVALESYIGSGIELVHACQSAAGWLLKFHAIRPEVMRERGPGEDRDEKPNAPKSSPVQTLETMNLDQTCARLVSCLQAKQAHMANLQRHVKRRSVLIHGTFGPETVLLKDGVTTAIKFDRSRFGDPSVDLARFAFYLWKRVFERSEQWQDAAVATNAFVAEYGASKPEHLHGLAYSWGARILKSLRKEMSRPRYIGSSELSGQMVEFHIAQFNVANGFDSGAFRPRTE